MSPILRASSTDHTGKGAGETDFVGARLVDALAEALTVAADTGGKANGSSLCRFAGGSKGGGVKFDIRGGEVDSSWRSRTSHSFFCFSHGIDDTHAWN